MSNISTRRSDHPLDDLFNEHVVDELLIIREPLLVTLLELLLAFLSFFHFLGRQFVRVPRVIGIAENFIQFRRQRFSSFDLLGIVRFLTFLDQLFNFGDHFAVEVLGNLIRPVPMRIVGPHHRRTMSSSAAFMVPNLEPSPVQVIAETRGPHERFGHGVQLDSGLGELLMIQVDQGVILNVEVVDPLLLMTVETDILHVASACLPIHVGAR